MGNFFMLGMAAAANSAHEAQTRDAVRNIDQASNLLKSDVKDLQEQVQRLSLLNQALWELLAEKLKITEAEFEARVRQVDLRDGVADGKMTDHPLRCPQCGRVSNSRHKKCLYCGLLFEGSLFG